MLEGEIGPRMKFKGKDVFKLSLNNYLGLANHPEVRKADADAAKDWGLSYPMGARMMSIQFITNNRKEIFLLLLVKKTVSFLIMVTKEFLSVIDALVDRKDVIVYDSECHACIIDGLRLHIGKRFVYPHNNIENLKDQLERATKIVKETGGGILVITEGVLVCLEIWVHSHL